MGVIKCKICGASLDITNDSTVATCSYCLTVQTLPRLSSDRKANLYERASHFRRNNEFDKAIAIYEQVLEDDLTDSESYWSMILCKHGITYVDDPQTGKKVPTINRTQYTSIFSDEDYKSAIKYADDLQRPIYEAEAKVIDDIQKGILDIYSREKPFDVFICYKETDDYGRRTLDSVLAYDIYKHLERENLKVFFSRVTLEDKLGQEYEPYIFSALHSAKVMIVLGTKPEYFEAAWVRNEWSRFLALRQAGENKTLVAAYRDMDPRKLPKEFSFLQAQDMSKIDFMQDLLRGVSKIVNSSNSAGRVNSNTNYSNSSNFMQLVKRGNIALEDKEWEKADEFFEEALNLNAECAEAYLGKFLVSKKISSIDFYFDSLEQQEYELENEAFIACDEDVSHINKITKENILEGYLGADEIRNLYAFDRGYTSYLSAYKKQKEVVLKEVSNEKLLSRARQYATNETKCLIEGKISKFTDKFDKQISDAQKDDEVNRDKIINSYKAHINKADEKARKLYGDALKKRNDDYKSLIRTFENANSISDYEKVMEKLSAFSDCEDSSKYAKDCQKRISELKEVVSQEKKVKINKTKKVLAVIAAVLAFIIVGKIILSSIKPFNREVVETTTLTSTVVTDSVESLLNETELVDSEIADDGLIYEPLNVGDTLFMGRYDDKDIEWQVLEVENDQALVISQDAICMKEFNMSNRLADWKTSAIREWLNNEFYLYSFDSTERTRIVSTSVNNSYYAVNDYIFLMDESEANLYFDSDSRVCEYEGDRCDWWLRSDGYGKYVIEYVETTGMINVAGKKANSENIGVRPVMWISLNYSLIDNNYEVLSNREHDFSNINVGDEISFGKFDGEELSWSVLAIIDNKALIIAKDEIDTRVYSDEINDMNWESSSIRQWLNGYFYDNAFDSGEQTMINLTELENSFVSLGFMMDNWQDSLSSFSFTKYNVSYTEDRVFFLSLDEARKYFTGEKPSSMRVIDYTLRDYCDDAGCFLFLSWDNNYALWDYYSRINFNIVPAMWITIDQ